MGGCAKPPGALETSGPLHYRAYQAESPNLSAEILPVGMPVTAPKPALPEPERIIVSGKLGGRTLAVATTADIVLQPREVILTFDDGPRAGRTPAILKTLDTFGVKATFLMLGASAEANPSLAAAVAKAGHTVGSHTYDHSDLTKLTHDEAMAEVSRGELAVARALALSGEHSAPFFRFPYLAQDGFLRTSLLDSGEVVLDVDVDSKDYYKDTPEVVAARTLERLEARGSGIILFHDIHQRTVDLLPAFLYQLELRGYSVVRLVPKPDGVFGRDVITAAAPSEDKTIL